MISSDEVVVFLNGNRAGVLFSELWKDVLCRENVAEEDLLDGFGLDACALDGSYVPRSSAIDLTGSAGR